MKSFCVVVIALQFATAATAAPHYLPPKPPAPAVKPPPAAQPCTLQTVSDDFSVTFHGKNTVFALVAIVNDMPMNREQMGVATTSVTNEIGAAVQSWCAAHKKQPCLYGCHP